MTSKISIAQRNILINKSTRNPTLYLKAKLTYSQRKAIYNEIKQGVSPELDHSAPKVLFKKILTVAKHKVGIKDGTIYTLSEAQFWKVMDKIKELFYIRK
jgi:hypothetical protein